MLKVWLPLTGTLENKGVSNINIVNENATINTAGKIGSCYSFNGSGYRIHLSGDELFKCIKGGSQPFSIAMWVFHEDSRRAILFGDYNSTGAINVNIELTTGHIVRFYWSGNPDYNTGVNIGASVWSHLTITYDGNKLCTYLNGVLAATSNITLSEKNKTSGEFFLGRDSRTSETALKGRLNDFRIYDHCLSAAEVHEISQGLVLHYKLDGGLFGNENFILKSDKITSGAQASNITRTYMDDGSMKIVATANNGNWASIGFAANSNTNIGNKLSVGDPYTISCDVKVESGTVLPSLFINAGNSYKQLQGTIILNQWIRAYYSSTWAEPGTSYGNISLHLGFSGAIGTYYFKNFKLEKSPSPTAWSPAPSDGVIDLTQIQDGSGYGHNGTIGGNLSIKSDTSRYSASLNFPENTSTITIPSVFSSGQTVNNITVSCWFKTNTLNSTAPNIFSLGENSFLRCRIASATSVWGYYRVVSTACSKTYSCKTVTDNTWHLLTFSFNNGVQKMYIDGDILGTTDNTSTGTYLTCASTAWHLAGYAANSENFLGNLSDFRIYVTTLSDTDIKQLYNTAAKIDNLGNWHTFEFKENNSIAKITKTGITEANEVYDNMNFNNRAQIVKNNATVLIAGDLNIVTTYSSSVKTGTMPSLPGATVQALAGKTLRFIYDVCAPGVRYSAEQGQTAWQYTCYGIHGSCTMDGSTNYPFAGKLNYTGDGIHAIQTWTIPTGKSTYGNLGFSIQNLDKPSSTNNATWFIRNVRLELVEGTSENITGTTLIER